MIVPAGYHTHFPVLAAALHLAPAGGHIFELGAGLWSTVMLHLCAQASGRHLTTLETDKEWLGRFDRLQGPGHDLVHVDPTPTGWSAAIETAVEVASVDCSSRKPVSLAFVDNAPESARRSSIERLRSHTAMFVMHDVDLEWDEAYNVASILSTFRHVWRFDLVRPNTALFSDDIEITFDERASLRDGLSICRSP